MKNPHTTPLPEGKIFHAQALNDAQNQRPLFVFVPKTLLPSAGKPFSRETFRATRWAAINAGANKEALGSHLFPDLTKPAAPSQYGDFPKKVETLAHKVLGKPDPARPPGREPNPEMP
jgi:hypothetical protein